ncbi:MAG: zinc-ribbon domain-containing protein [Pyrinomonadaceae bacterium]
MFCPKCGQQSSDEVRFCPRCGLQLAGLAAYVAGNEYAPARPDAARDAELTAKRLGTRRGAKLMFFSAVLFPIFFGLCFLVDGPGPLFVPVTVFLAGFAMLLYARLFGDELIRVQSRSSRRDLGAGSERPALGAPQFNPAPLFNQQRANTAEIYQPPSVTENTTRLLDKDS